MPRRSGLIGHTQSLTLGTSSMAARRPACAFLWPRFRSSNAASPARRRCCLTRGTAGTPPSWRRPGRRDLQAWLPRRPNATPTCAAPRSRGEEAGGVLPYPASSDARPRPQNSLCRRLMTVPGKVADDARFDGMFVLPTNAQVTPLQAVLRYRDLLQVEDLFRTAKPIFNT